jgi:hypothetical protein
VELERMLLSVLVEVDAAMARHRAERGTWDRAMNEGAAHDHRPDTLRRAMRRPDLYLAAVLAEETDDSLAAPVRCPVDQVWRLRLMNWPRPAEWDVDVRAMAGMIRGDYRLLAVLLRRIGA